MFHQMVICMFILIYSVFISSQERISDNCDIVLRYVPDFGVGVYAGKLLKPDDTITDAIGIPVPNDLRYGNELDLYVEQLNNTHDLISTGYSLLINHCRQSEGFMTAKEFNQKDYNEPNKLKYKYHDGYSSDMKYFALWTYFPGDQIFIQYGDIWFTSRELPEISIRETLNRDILHIDNIQYGSGRITGCSSLYTKFEGNRLLSAVHIPMGEVIEVARALLIPENERFFTSGPLTEFAWRRKLQTSSNTTRVKNDYLYTVRVNNHVQAYDPYSSYFLVLLGNGALYSGLDDGRVANVKYDWWDLSMIGVSDHEYPFTLDSKESDSFCASGYPDDYDGIHDKMGGGCIKSFRRTDHGNVCSTRMFVSFVATRDIMIGEELVVDLSVDEQGFRYASDIFADQCL